MKKARKIQILHRVQNALDHSEQVAPLSAGLTEKEFQEMANEELFELRFSKENPEWSEYSIAGISEKAEGLLSNSEPLPPSLAGKTFRGVGNKLWAIFLVVLAAVVAWYLKKHFV